MEVHLKPELKAKLDQWTAETGRSGDELIEDAMAGYFDEPAHVRVQGIDGAGPKRLYYP